MSPQIKKPCFPQLLLSGLHVSRSELHPSCPEALLSRAVSVCPSVILLQAGRGPGAWEQVSRPSRCWPGQLRPQPPLCPFGASQRLQDPSGLLGIRTARSRSPSEACRMSASEPSGSARGAEGLDLGYGCL